ncbi:MAG: BlaI/MecI/CopY family transcriptional regulator [Prevotella sp.]|nr:BlaI/MecI/CopY family transcriptional regulator [Prevotella sp.]
MEKLTKQEEEVMQQVWQLNECTVKEVLQQLPEPKPPYTTVASVMQNLKRKLFVSQRQQGKTYIYEPLIAESDYKRGFMSGFVRDYFRGSFRDMVSFFAQEEKLSSDDLKDIIREIEGGEGLEERETKKEERD